MEDLQYKELIKSYDLETLSSVKNLIDREAFEDRLIWVEAEIAQRQQGIGPKPAPDVHQFDLSRDENFAGFMYRLPALIIDLLIVYVPVNILFSIILNSNFWYAIALLPLLYPFYQISLTLNGRQSAGKRLLGIIVIDQDMESPLTMRKTLIRHSPDLFFALGMILSIVWLISQGFAPYDQATVDASISGFYLANSAWDQLDDLWDIWIWSEILLLTFDSRRRSLHEWLSNTLVIHKSRQRNIDRNQTFEPSYCEWLTQLQHKLLGDN